MNARFKQRIAHIAAGLLLASVPSSMSASDSGVASDFEGVHELARTWVEGQGHARDDARAKLQELGVSAAPELLTFLASLSTPEATSDAVVPLRSWLERFPVEEVIEAVLNSTDGQEDLSGRLRTVRRLGEFARAAGIRPLLATADAMDAEQRQHPTIRREVQGALGQILGADPRALKELKRAARKLPSDLDIVVVRSLEKSPQEGSFEMLEAYLGRRPELDRVVLESLGHLPPWLESVVDGSCTRLVRGYVSSRDQRTRRAAVIALGRVGDTAALDQLMGLLDDDDRHVRAGALWSLQQLSGLTWGEDILRWERWYESELRWLDELSRDLVDAAHDADAGRAFAALREISEHRAFASQLADELERVTRHENAGVARTSCETLQRLGGPRAMQALAHALDDHRDAIRTAAARGLERLGAPTDPRRFDF